MTRRESTPLYKKIADDLRVSIEGGTFKKGDLLPSENDLSKKYKTTRVTIRQALSGLMNMGYITRRHGKGSIVSEPRKSLGILSLNGVTASVGIHNLKTIILQNPVKQAWPPDFFYDLDDEELEKGCIYLSRLRLIDQIPVLYEETFITDMELGRFINRNLENKSLFEILKKSYGVEIKSGEQNIWALNANERTSDLLKVVQSHPVVHMKRKLITNVKGLHIFSFIYCNTEEYFLQDYF